MFDAIRKAVQFVAHTAHQAAEAVTDQASEPKAATAPAARRDTAEFRRQLPSLDPGSPAGKLQQLGKDDALAAGRWDADRPLSEAVNAHRTNTVEEMREALLSDHDYNWFEGDVRWEINHSDRLEMRHDGGHESGDNLTLKEWLTIGRDAGRGLKLDFKDGDGVPQALELIKEVGVPAERVMINLGGKDSERYGALVREALPGAILAVNPADALGDKENTGPYEDWQIDHMIALAERFGPPVTFPTRIDRLTPEAIARLEEAGSVSVWNAPSRSGVSDPKAEADNLRAQGVTGMIDLSRSMSNLDKVEAAAEWGVQEGKNLLRKGWDAIF